MPPRSGPSVTPTNGLHAILTRTWLRRGPLALLLWPLSVVYRMLWALRRMAYARGWKASTRLPVPVVVVGNVVAGGAGKTPVVIAIAQHLRRHGLRVGVISRGYGRAEAPGGDQPLQALEVHPHSDPHTVGDEPLLIRRATHAPVFVARNRVHAAQALLALHPRVQVILADDGLQHLALQRDVEVCVFDERGLGNGFLLPAGLLREPWPRPAQPGVQALLLHRGGGAAGADAGVAAGHRVAASLGIAPSPTHFALQRSLANHALSVDGIRLPLSTLATRPLVALAGIAQPEAFFAMLRAIGLPLADTVALPDHYDFRSLPWASLIGKTILCTEKDAAKIAALKTELAVFAVPLVLEFDPAFWAALDASLQIGPTQARRSA
jgi:tetraacyldisaccharide 4'-kinase